MTGLVCPLQQSVILVEAGTVNRLVIFNSHARKRQEMVTFRLSAFSVKVGGNLEQAHHIQQLRQEMVTFRLSALTVKQEGTMNNSHSRKVQETVTFRPGPPPSA
jgi:hypothetical protein